VEDHALVAPGGAWADGRRDGLRVAAAGLHPGAGRVSRRLLGAACRLGPAHIRSRSARITLSGRAARVSFARLSTQYGFDSGVSCQRRTSLADVETILHCGTLKGQNWHVVATERRKGSRSETGADHTCARLAGACLESRGPAQFHRT
jgi:hypothetical protein